MKKKKIINILMCIKKNNIIMRINSRKLEKIEYVLLNLIFLQKGKITKIKKDILNFGVRKGERLGSYWNIENKKIKNILLKKIKFLKLKKMKIIKDYLIIISDIVKESNCIILKNILKVEKYNEIKK